jgi:NADH dehydrogenase
MSRPTRRIAVLGGTGFVGTALVSRLATAGHELRVLTRDPSNGRSFAVLPTVRMLQTDVHDESALRTAFTDCDTVVNLVGILNEKGFSGAGFTRAHAELTRKTVAAAAASGVSRLLHMSALGAAVDGPSFYLQSKGVAESHVRARVDRLDDLPPVGDLRRRRLVHEPVRGAAAPVARRDPFGPRRRSLRAHLGR